MQKMALLTLNVIFSLTMLTTLLQTNNQRPTASGQAPPPGPARAPCVGQTGPGSPAPAG